MGIATIDEAKYERMMTAPAGVAVIEFGASWCPPCRTLEPILDELSAEYGGAAAIVKVDCDRSPELASMYGVMSMPTVVVFKDGQPVDKLVGLRPKSAYRTVIDRLTGSAG